MAGAGENKRSRSEEDNKKKLLWYNGFGIASQKQETTGGPKKGHKKFITYEKGMSISHRMDTEIPAKAVIRRSKSRCARDIEDVMRV